MLNSMINFENEYKRKSQTYFNVSAATYDKTSDMGIKPVLMDCIFERLMDQPQPEAILDVGCGTGELLARISGRMNASLAGLDISSNMLAVARNKLNPAVDLREGDAENLPWQSQSFDIVLCTLSFHHYPQPDQALSEMKRVLKPGGKLLIADIAMPTPVRQLANFILPLLSTGDRHFYSQAEIETRLYRTGFQQFMWQQVDESTFLISACVP